MASSLRVRFAAPRSPDVKPVASHRFMNSAVLDIIDRTLRQQGVQGVEGGLVVGWQDMLPSTPNTEQKGWCLLKSSPSKAVQKKHNPKRNEKRCQSDAEDQNLAKRPRVAEFTIPLGEHPNGDTTDKVAEDAARQSTSENGLASNGDVRHGSGASLGQPGKEQKHAKMYKLKIKLKPQKLSGEKTNREECKTPSFDEEVGISPSSAMPRVGTERSIPRSVAETQVLPIDLVPMSSSGVQALPTVCEKEVQTGPQQPTHSTLEEHLVRLRELLISATSAIPTKAYDAIWSEGRVLKKLAESRSRQASGINMETVEFYLHSALKFLEAAHTQEKKRDRHTRRYTMYKDTGDLLLHTAELLRKYAKLKPFVKKCAHILAERLAAVAYVRCNFLEHHNQMSGLEASGTIKLPPQKLARDTNVTSEGLDNLFKGLELTHATTRELYELQATAKKLGAVAFGAVELISALGNHAGLGDIRETLIIAQYAIENLSRCNE